MGKAMEEIFIIFLLQKEWKLRAVLSIIRTKTLPEIL
jgi:hypothetical protein